MSKLQVMASLALALTAALPASAGGVRGEYIEARTADVYTGPCFSNSEVFIQGDQGVMAWKVTEGTWDGVDLSGLVVAAAVQGNTTFSEDRPEQARTVLIVDRRADSAQRAALIAMAKSLGGKRLEQIAAVRTSRLSFTVEAHATAASAEHSGRGARHATPHAPRASFWAPGLAEILTRPLDETDHTCGNETVAYPPLSRGVEALPAYTLTHKFQGAGLGGNWDDPSCRSSFVGRFAVE